MSIARRGDGRYVVKYKTIDGWKQKSFRSRDAAEAFEKEFQFEADAQSSTRLTVIESMTAFLKATRHCDKRRGLYMLTLDYLGENFCKRYVDSLERRDLEWARDVLKDRKLSNRAINDHVTHLLTAWRWCVSEDLLKTVPWEKYRKLPSEPLGHWCGSQKDFQTVYNACQPHLQWFVRTCLALCCRPGKEVLSLLWKHVHLDEAYAEVWMYKVSAKKMVRLPEWWIREARQRKGDDDAKVCPGAKGGSFRPSLLWYRKCKELGIKGCPLYTVRHFAATKMLEAGADLAAVAAQLGHRNITTTGAFYAHATEVAQLRAATLIPALDMVQGTTEKHTN